MKRATRHSTLKNSQALQSEALRGSVAQSVEQRNSSVKAVRRFSYEVPGDQLYHSSEEERRRKKNDEVWATNEKTEKLSNAKKWMGLRIMSYRAHCIGGSWKCNQQ